MIVSSNWAFYVISAFLLVFNSAWRFVVESKLPWRERLREVSKSSRRDVLRGTAKLVIFWAILLSASFINVLHEDRSSWEKSLQDNRQLQSDNQQLRNDYKALDAQNRSLQSQLTGLVFKESPNSLRRRTVRLADKIYSFLEGRYEHHPVPYARRSRTNQPEPDAEREKLVKANEDYDEATRSTYVTKYSEQAIGIIEEYRAKGVSIGHLEDYMKLYAPSFNPPESINYGDPSDSLFWFRCLAYRVDATDNKIYLDSGR